MSSHARGLWAERLAGLYLRLKGYRVLVRRYKAPVGEIDLICRKGSLLVFVEVKRRHSGNAREALHPRQQARIARAAEAFLQRHPDHAGLDCRFDLVAIGRFKVAHVEDVYRG